MAQRWFLSSPGLFTFAPLTSTICELICTIKLASAPNGGNSSFTWPLIIFVSPHVAAATFIMRFVSVCVRETIVVCLVFRDGCCLNWPHSKWCYVDAFCSVIHSLGSNALPCLCVHTHRQVNHVLEHWPTTVISFYCHFLYLAYMLLVMLGSRLYPGSVGPSNNK